MKTWTITEPNGTKRTVTLEQFKAIIAERRDAAKPIMDAWKRNDIDGTAAAQQSFRKRFA